MKITRNHNLLTTMTFEVPSILMSKPNARHSSKMPNPKIIPFLLGSALFVISGYLLYNWLPDLVIRQIQKRVNISPNSPIYELWRDTPIPIYQRFYFFNITNAHDIEQSGAKPVVQEVGPFTYRMRLQKQQIVFHANQTVSYRETKTWHFVRSLSAMDDRTLITTVNTPLVSTLTVLQRVPPAIRTMITVVLNTLTEGLFIKRSVKQLTFAGYRDLLVTFGPMIDPKVPDNHGYFGYLYGKNNTADGTYTVFTGADDPSKLNYIDKLNGQSKLSLWKSDECNSLNNTFNGQLHPSLIDNFTPNYQFFNELFGRKFNLNFDSVVEPFEGVKAYKYVFDENNFKNSIDYPPNACYTSNLPADQSIPMSRRSPVSDPNTNVAQNVLLNLARRRLSGEPIELFNRPSTDRSAPINDSSANREEALASPLTSPPSSSSSSSSTPSSGGSSQMALQTLRMLANSVTNRALERLGRLRELPFPVSRSQSPDRIVPTARDAARPLTLIPSPTPIITSSVPSSTAALIRPKPGSAFVTAEEMQAKPSTTNNKQVINADSYTSATQSPVVGVNPAIGSSGSSASLPLTTSGGLMTSSRTEDSVPVTDSVSNSFAQRMGTHGPQPKEVPLLHALFRTGPNPLESAREFARNLTRTAPFNTMITNVFNSALFNRVLGARSAPEVLQRRSRQIQNRRQRRSRLRRRQIQEPNVSFAHLRQMNKFPSGAFDFSKVAFGAPILLSLPHFLKADPFYLKQVDGLQPNQSKHEFYLDVEPITGSSVNTAFRFQLNLAFTRNPGLFRYRNIRETVIPILWQEITLEMPEQDQRKLRLMTIAPQASAQIAFLVGTICSLILLALAVRTHLFARRAQVKQADPMDNVISGRPTDLMSAATQAQFDSVRDFDQQRLHRPMPEPKHGIDNPIPVEP